jgi:hypothetical protein
VSGPVSQSRLPWDWNNGPGPEEYYTRGLLQADVIKRMLMYGFVTGGIDIPTGTAYGLSVRFHWVPPTTTIEINRLQVPVGASGLNRTPSHQ